MQHSPPPHGPRLADLTAVRALFAAWVFAYHVHLQIIENPAPDAAKHLLMRGYLGVDGFFILSGMVLALAHPRLGLARDELLGFWARRLRRIYPVHLAMILLLAALLGVGWLLGLAPRQPERFGLGELLRSLLLVQAWGFSDRLAWNYPSWSVSTEWAGYLLFPWLWLAVRRTPLAAVAALPPLLLLVLLAENVVRMPHSLNLTYGGALLRFFPEFLAGMAITRLAPAAAPRMSGTWLAAGGLALILLAEFGLPDAAVVAGEAMALAGLLIAGQQGARPILAWLPGLHGLGTISYAFYMSFASVEALQTFLWRRLAIQPASHPALFIVLTAAMTLALGLAAWALIERPLAFSRKRV